MLYTVAHITAKKLTEMYRSTLLDIAYEERNISSESDASEQRSLT